MKNIGDVISWSPLNGTFAVRQKHTLNGYPDPFKYPGIYTIDNSLKDLPTILQEAAAILAGDMPMRMPIVDELHGFAAMLKEKT